MYDTLPHALLFAVLGAGSRIGCSIFVMIGAWFLCEQPFRTRRVLNLWLSLWLYTVPLTILCYFVPGSNVGLGTLRWAVFPVSTKQLWFVAAYVVLLLLSPVLNLVLRAAPRRTLRGLLAGFGVLLVGYSTLFAEDGVFSDVLWTFAYEYLLIGYLRIYPDSRLTRAIQTRRAAALALLFTVALTALRGFALWQGIDGKAMQYLEYYRTALCSAPNLLCALAFFFWFKHLNIGSLRAVNTVASATLGVYIIHQTPVVIGILWNGIFHAAEHPGSAGYALFVIVTVFVVCTGIDLLRSRLLIRRLEQTRWFVAACRRGDDLAAGLDKMLLHGD